MSELISCASIADLPRVLTIRRGVKQYVTLPVMLLAVQQLRMGVLLVTDFTENPELAVAQGQGLQIMPSEFMFGDTPLNNRQLLLVGIPSERLKSLWKQLVTLDPGVASPRNEDTSNILRFGFIAILNFRVQEYRGCLEGFCGNITVCTDSLWREATADVPRDVTSDFLRRVATNIDGRTRGRMSRHFPVEHLPPTVARDMNPTPAKRSVSANLQTQLPKVRRLEPREAVYQQQVSQVRTRPIEKDTVPSELDAAPEMEAVVPAMAAGAPGTAPTGAAQARNHGAGVRPHPPNARAQNQQVVPVVGPLQWQIRFWAANTVNRVDLGVLAQLQPHLVPLATRFEVQATIAHITPGADMVFVKPYGRTLKFAATKMTLTSEGHTCVVAELHTENEACAFFELEEIEEAMGRLGPFVRALQTVQNRAVVMRVESRGLPMCLGQIRPYWGVQLNLRELTGGVAVP